MLVIGSGIGGDMMIDHPYLFNLLIVLTTGLLFGIFALAAIGLKHLIEYRKI